LHDWFRCKPETFAGKKHLTDALNGARVSSLDWLGLLYETLEYCAEFCFNAVVVISFHLSHCCLYVAGGNCRVCDKSREKKIVGRSRRLRRLIDHRFQSDLKKSNRSK